MSSAHGQTENDLPNLREDGEKKSLCPRKSARHSDVVYVVFKEFQGVERAVLELADRWNSHMTQPAESWSCGNPIDDAATVGG
jgi:hypothetical protein